MTTFDALFALARRSPLRTLVASAVFGSLVLALGAAVLPARQEVAIDFTVDHRARQATADYAYDGYYALRATELFADTLISWFSTPSFVKAVHERADRPLDEFIPLPTRMFRAKKFSSQNVVVRFVDPEATGDSELAEAVVAEVAARAALLNPDADGGAMFEVTASEPVRMPTGVQPRRAAVAGFLAGAAAGALLLYFAHGRAEAEKKGP